MYVTSSYLEKRPSRKFYRDLDGSKVYYETERHKNRAPGGGDNRWLAHAWDNYAVGPFVKFTQLGVRGIYQAMKYVRNFNTWGDVREQGYGLLQRGQAIHPDRAVKKELGYLADTKQWPTYWHHAGNLGKESNVPLPNPRLIQMRRQFMLRKRRRFWKKSRFLKKRKKGRFKKY